MYDKKYIFIDYSWLLHKSFYAHKGLTAIVGDRRVDTATLFGFVQFMKSARKRFDNCELIFCLDSPHNYRKERCAEYKANRIKDRAQNPLELNLEIQSFLANFPEVHIFDAYGYEGDDVINTLCKVAHIKNNSKYIFSGDNDLLQLLVDPKTKIIKSLSDSGYEELGPEYAVEKFGITPDKLLVFRSIIGDASDNIKPVIPRFLKKNALIIAGEYDRPVGQFTAKHQMEWKPKVVSITEHYEKWQMNYDLMKLVDIPFDQITRKMPASKPLNYFMTQYQMGSLKDWAI